MAASQFYVQYRSSGNGIMSESPPRRGPLLMQQLLPNPFEEHGANPFEEHGVFNVGGGPARSPDSPVGAGAAVPVKKKRGRPRKYAPDGLSPATSSRPVREAGAEAGASGEPTQKRGRGRPPGSGRKQQLAALGGWIASSAGTGFAPHPLIVAAGEDVTAKIMSFSQQGPRAVCILSANGTVSTVSLQNPCGDPVTYEGRFEILTMSGSYLPTDDGGSSTRTGGFNISLSGPDGRVIGGGVSGMLIAASPVQIIVGSFVYGGSKMKKTETPQEAGESESPTGGDPGTPPALGTGGWSFLDQADTQNSYDQRE